MGQVVHVEICADDIERAKKFYQMFGWNMVDANLPSSEYWLARSCEGMGTDGAIMPRSYNPNQPITNIIAVGKLDDMIEKVKAVGGQIDGDKNTIEGVGDFVYAFDTEGNRFGMLPMRGQQYGRATRRISS